MIWLDTQHLPPKEIGLPIILPCRAFQIEAGVWSPTGYLATSWPQFPYRRWHGSKLL